MLLPSWWRTAAAALSLAAVAVPAAGQNLSSEGAPASAGIVFPGGGARPVVLDEGDVARYRRIFAAQDEGRWEDAEREIAGLGDPLLLGHVRFHKLMHPTAHRSSFSELAEWLGTYADHPDARRVHRLARRRQPDGAPPPPKPVDPRYLGGQGESRPPDTASAVDLDGDDVAQEVMSLVRKGVPAAALARLHDGTSTLGPEEVACLEGYVANAFFVSGEFWRSFVVAQDAAAISGERHPWIHLRAGLAAWRLSLPWSALTHFAEAARAEAGTDWTRAAGAYWAARAHSVQGETAAAEAMLRVAAGFPRTLYGQLARELQGDAPGLEWRAGTGNPIRTGEAVLARPEARRAVALVQVGRIHEADLELRYLAGRLESGHEKAILGLAEALRLPSVQIRLASRIAALGETDLSALYPVSDWTLPDAFSIDRALVHAVIRKESGFHVRAKSPSGARGLMQVMPATARQLSGDPSLRGRGADQLYDPGLNLEMGQELLGILLDLPDIQGNLVFTLTAYNAGPSRLRALREEIGTDDPLMFIESIPLKETRWFVKRVLTSLWLYRDRLGEETPSRGHLARDEWPLYVPVDQEPPSNAGA